MNNCFVLTFCSRLCNCISLCANHFGIKSRISSFHYLAFWTATKNCNLTFITESSYPRSWNTLHSIEECVPGFFVPLGFYPWFSYRATHNRCIFYRFFLFSCYANFFTYVTAPALKFFDYGYIFTFPVYRYISIYVFQAIVNNIRTCTLMFMYCQHGFTSSFTV